MTFQSTHNLQFLCAPWHTDDWKLYQVGTVGGQWRDTPIAYEILSFLNDEPGNGHLNDVFEWFENSCKRDGKNLVVLELMNDRFRQHLIIKRGFSLLTENSVIKVFNQST